MKRYTAFSMCTLMALMIASPAMAQGTATGPSTAHTADSANQAGYAGGPNDLINGPGPYPIDLDVGGLPWRKAFAADPATGYFSGGSFNLFEEVINVGTESWDGWVENLIPGAIGAAWLGVSDIRVNGVSIAFNTTITGSLLTVDGFSTLVLPGDTLELDKQMFTTANVIGPGNAVTLLSIQQFPIPEPASAALIGLGGLMVLGKRRADRSVG